MHSLPKPSKESFSLPGAGASALLLHGFSGTPYELRLVGEALSAAGIGAVAPLLPGHGTSPTDLNLVSHHEWLHAARHAFEELDPKNFRFLVGCSMGGLLALILAAELGDRVDGMALLAPALHIGPVSHLGVILSRVGLGKIIPRIPKAEAGGDIGDPLARAANPTYDSMPLVAVSEFDAVRRKAGRRLQDVRTPTYITHGAKDDTARPASSLEIAKRISSPWIERDLMPHSQHVLGLDRERDEVCRRVVSFFQRVQS